MWLTAFADAENVFFIIMLPFYSPFWNVQHYEIYHGKSYITNQIPMPFGRLLI